MLLFSLPDAASICIGTALEVRNHSPLNALISQLLNSAQFVSTIQPEETGKLTIIKNPIRIMEINPMITIRENMNIIILHPRQIQLIQQCKRILHMYIVVRNAMCDEEPNILMQRCRV